MNSGKKRNTFDVSRHDIRAYIAKRKKNKISTLKYLFHTILCLSISPMSAVYRIVSNKKLELFNNLLLNCFIIITIIAKRHILYVFFFTVFHKLTCIILAIIITRYICNVIIVSANDRLFFQHRHNISYVLHKVIYFVFVSKYDNTF